MVKILIADDDRTLATLLAALLTEDGYQPITVYDGASVLQAMASQPDLVLLDVGLPHIDGFTLCQQIRQTSDVPIIFLSAHTEVYDRVRGLRSGGDDYIVKPFEPAELLARITAVLRRASVAPEQPLMPISQQGLTLIPLTYEVVTAKQTIALTPLEFRLLHYLMLNSGQVLRSTQLIEHIWGVSDETSYHSALTTYIARLRAKIEPEQAHPRYLITVHGTGYRFGTGDSRIVQSSQAVRASSGDDCAGE